MSDLKVDFDTLEASHSTAVSLKSQFDDLPHRVGDTAWGNGKISDAMHTFGTNWDYHRAVLSDKIKEVGEKIEGCITTFHDADQKLYDSLTKSEKGGHE